MAVGAVYEAMWRARRRLDVGDLKVTPEGGTLYFEGKRPKGVRAKIVEGAIKWCLYKYGVPITPRHVTTCLVEYRAFLAANKPPT
jgi:hypothetical protein